MRKWQDYLHSLALGLAILLAVGSSGWGQEAAPASAEPKGWERSIALGLSVKRGNSDTLLFTGAITAQREWEKDFWLLGADGAYGEDNDVRNNALAHAMVQYKRLFTPRFYGYVNLDVLHDAVADIDYRLSVGPGAGYFFIKSDLTRLSAEIGPSYVREKKGGESDDYLALRVGERFERKLNDNARIWQSAEYLPDVGDFANYILIGELGAEAAIVKGFSLRVVLTDRYASRPAPGRERNDLMLVSALAYKF